MNLFEKQANEFAHRHIGPNEHETKEMLSVVGATSLDELIDKAIPSSIRNRQVLDITPPMNENEYLAELQRIASMNKIFKNYIGQGYYDTITPSVILRNIFENPGWYTQYTPYQAEIAQGRLESLLNFQTVVADLTGLALANASLLDEGTAAAEAMIMFFNQKNKDHDHVSVPKFFVDEDIFEQTKDILITRASPLGIELVMGNFKNAVLDSSFFGAIVQYPDSNGSIGDYKNFIGHVHEKGGLIAMATDLLALAILKSPGELDADVAIGCAQRFGVPMGFGGPHAAFFSTKEEFKRSMPGRIIGVSVDAQGNRALRMALQTREQHIKREKATSNICTSQALLANMAAMFAVYHGPEGLKDIAKRVNLLARTLSYELEEMGYPNVNEYFFDTLKIKARDTAAIRTIAEARKINFHYFESNYVGISLDETCVQQDVVDILTVFAEAAGSDKVVVTFEMDESTDDIPSYAVRKSEFLTHAVFNSHRSETEMMRYIKSLENKDLALNTSMIPLGSCTMKLNAATELIPLSWPAFSKLHPFAPENQWEGYKQIIRELEEWLCRITGFAATSLQPNSGAQGEYAGLLAIRAYHASNKQEYRNLMLIPVSAHGTNPASAVMAGMKVIVVQSDEEGHIDVNDLKVKAAQFKNNLAGLMVTYPSTHGVFEESIREICEAIHDNGGLVYMDGANMNAQVGLTSPGFIGADVCHLNLHKTFSIPHGGGGPGMGPICVNEKLKPFLPGHRCLSTFKKNGVPSATRDLRRISGTGSVSSAPFGSASILLISYGYIRMLGSEGVTRATKYAILNANYMKSKLEKYFEILYSSKNGTCAHEFIVDLRSFKNSTGIEAEDVAKRLMDYGFHAPTLSFPVPGTIMIEPTESEDKSELDRFCDALINIHLEIDSIKKGNTDKADNPLKNAPHTINVICADEWTHGYSRQHAAFPLPFVKDKKFWPAVARVNNTFGDRNLICTCEPLSAYAEEEVQYG